MSVRLRVVILCLISAVICGVLTAGQCPVDQYGSVDICSVGAAASLLAPVDPPTPLQLWTHWVNWFPGLVFGVLFLLALAPGSAPRLPARALLFVPASGLIYLLAGIVFAAAMGLMQSISAAEFPFSLVVSSVPGALAGFLGAILLRLTARSSIPDTASASARATSLVGAAAGIAFFLVAFSASLVMGVRASWSLAFMVWQIPVALLLSSRARSLHVTPPGLQT